jgi:hypothetical protein
LVPSSLGVSPSSALDNPAGRRPRWTSPQNITRVNTRAFCASAGAAAMGYIAFRDDAMVNNADPSLCGASPALNWR